MTRHINEEEKWLTNANICFWCKYACGKCPWSESFTPIKGWTATKVERKETVMLGGKYVKRKTKTYHITECPLFEEG